MSISPLPQWANSPQLNIAPAGVNLKVSDADSLPLHLYAAQLDGITEAEFRGVGASAMTAGDRNNLVRYLRRAAGMLAGRLGYWPLPKFVEREQVPYLGSPVYLNYGHLIGFGKRTETPLAENVNVIYDGTCGIIELNIVAGVDLTKISVKHHGTNIPIVPSSIVLKAGETITDVDFTPMLTGDLLIYGDAPDTSLVDTLTIKFPIERMIAPDKQNRSCGTIDLKSCQFEKSVDVCLVAFDESEAGVIVCNDGCTASEPVVISAEQIKVINPKLGKIRVGSGCNCICCGSGVVQINYLSGGCLPLDWPEILDAWIALAHALMPEKPSSCKCSIDSRYNGDHKVDKRKEAASPWGSANGQHYAWGVANRKRIVRFMR